MRFQQSSTKLYFLLLSLFCYSITTVAADDPSLPDNLQFIERYYEKQEANGALTKLLQQNSTAHIITRKVQLTLKALNLGLYPNQTTANKVVQHLKENGIKAFSHEMSSGDYRVHAGALHEKEYYQERHNKLRELGYKQIETSETEIDTIEYLIVIKREKGVSEILTENANNAWQSYVNQTRLKHTRFNAEFLFWNENETPGSSNYFNSAINYKTTYKTGKTGKTGWVFNYGARFTVTEQSGIQRYQKAKLLLEPIYLHIKSNRHNWHIGAADTVWDNENPLSLSDNITRHNLERYKLDINPEDKRLPSWGIRWQYSHNKYLWDINLFPIFEPANLPQQKSIWHPISLSRGKAKQINTEGDLAYLLKNGALKEKNWDTGGIAVRLDKMIGTSKRAITLQYVRHNTPYPVLNNKLQSALVSGESVTNALQSINDHSFSLEHPYTAVFTLEERGAISQFEIALLSNTPYTTTNYQMKTAPSANWKLGFDYPHLDRGEKITLYFKGRHISTQETILDQKTRVAIAGVLSTVTKNKSWTLSFTYDIGLNQYDLFLNPRVIFNHSKHVNITLNYQVFAGTNGTEFGYHNQHSNLSIAWLSRF